LDRKVPMSFAQRVGPLAPQNHKNPAIPAKHSNRIAVRVLLWVAAAMALAIFLRWLYVLPVDLSREIPESALFSSSPSDSDKAVSAQLWADRNKISPGQTLSVRLNFRNTSALPVSDLRLVDLQTPGFRIIGPTLQSPSSLPPFASATSPALTLQPTTGQGRFRIALVFVWSNKKVAEARDVVSIGPIEILSEGQRRRLAFLRRLATLFKDMTLPLVLAALGFWFQRRQSERDQVLKHAEWERDTRLKTEQALRDKNFKEDQEERDRRHQIWASILPRFHELSERHYLPIVRSLRIVTEQWQGSDADDEKSSEYLYQVLMLLRRMKYLRDEKGQIFFSDRTAERVVSISWRLIVERVKAEFTTAKYDAALRMIEPADTYLDFVEKAQKANNNLIYKDLLPKLRGWVTTEKQGKPSDFNQYIQVLNVLKASFYFEANRPFDEYWYGSKPDFGLKLDILDGLPTDPSETTEALRQTLKQYIADTQAYLASH
jgi:hypothetical protein